jgi:hypothetical protein
MLDAERRERIEERGGGGLRRGDAAGLTPPPAGNVAAANSPRFSDETTIGVAAAA